MDETIPPVRNETPPPEVNSWRNCDEQRRREVEEAERQQERPREDGKGQYVDVLA